MDELHTEHAKVSEEIKLIESEIIRLTQKKNNLLERKLELSNSIKRLKSTSQSKAAHSLYENSHFAWSHRVNVLLKSIFKIADFRPLQLQTINATLSGKDCILVLPTGGGKSLCYQLPALVDESGFTLVISPLLSLIEDQLHGLELLNISAVSLNSTTHKEETKMVFAAMENRDSTSKKFRLIYVTPEKIAKSKTFMSKLERAYSLGLLNRIAIDEVHCCSQWGHDFRPDYKFLGVLKRQFSGVPIIGLTATASSRVLNDIEKMLNIPSCLFFRASYNRKNLYYEVIEKPSNATDAMKMLARLIKKHYPGQSGIVYCLTQKDSEEVAGYICSSSIRAACYHAGLNGEARKNVHIKWIQGKIQVIVATVAFGMGIDKPNVRFVIHFSPSKSLENYYQESGRAGRDNEYSDCILMFRVGDAYRLSTMVFGEQNGLDNVYSMLRYCVLSQGCRRSLVAQYFNETWSSDDCANRCDLCQQRRRNTNSITMNLSSIYTQILKIIAEQKVKVKQSRVTALKLVDIIMMSKYDHIVQSCLEFSAMDKRKFLESFVLHLVLEGYLVEDFHFTPYNTISYIAAGHRSVDDCTNIPYTVIPPIVDESSNMNHGKCIETSSMNFKIQDKGISVVNPACSKIVSDRLADVKDISLQRSQSCSNDGPVTKPVPVKRPSTVISLIEDDDLDFGDDLVPAKFRKTVGQDSQQNLE